jgi:hypothetical protein
MKTIFLICVVILNTTFVLWADDATTSLPLNKTPDAKQKLEAFEKEAMTLKELTEKDGDAGRQELIDYYLSHTNDVSVKAKLPISRCFAIMENYQQATRLAAEYVQVYSNDWHGWKILGTAHMFIGSNNAAVRELTAAAKLGDDYSYAPLAFTALQIDRLDIVSNLVQRLLVLKKQEPPPEAGQLDIVTVLVIYSLKADQKEVFIKALEGVSAKQILSRDDLPQGVKAGCERFNGKAIDKIRAEMETAAGNNTNSSNTNSSSP